MGAIAISDETYRIVEEYMYERRTTRKDIAEKMIKFANNNRESFAKEMF